MQLPTHWDQENEGEDGDDVASHVAAVVVKGDGAAVLEGLVPSPPQYGGLKNLQNLTSKK